MRPSARFPRFFFDVIRSGGDGGAVVAEGRDDREFYEGAPPRLILMLVFPCLPFLTE